MAFILVGVIALTSLQTESLTRTERHQECRFQTFDGHMGWTPREVKRTIRCAAERFSVDTSKAMYIADRESNFTATAVNPYSGACGVFQHLPRYWTDRIVRFKLSHRRLELTGRRCFNARSNVLTAMWMVHLGGWGPWGG